MSRDGSDLCARCGLCCDGSLYDRARAEPDEKARLEQFGLAPFEAEAGAFFPLPCPRLSGSCCTIYEQRFTICRSFHCKLLTRYLGGEVPLEEALGRVTTARTLLTSVAAADPVAAAPMGRVELAKQARERMANGEGAARAEAARRLVDVVALENYLDRHFRKVPDSASLLE
jgi:hypothetical protein